SQRSNEAAVKYFLLGAFSLGILLYGMSLMYGLSGTTNLRVMATRFAGQEQNPLLVLAVILVVAGVGFKIAAVPFHMWAPDVYEGAPTPITAFLSVGSKAASFAMLLRVFGDELKDFSGLHVRNPFAAFAMLLFMLSLGGIPPTAGFMGKFWLFSSAIDAGYYWLAVIGVLNSAVSLYYYVRVVVFMYLKK